MCVRVQRPPQGVWGGGSQFSVELCKDLEFSMISSSISYLVEIVQPLMSENDVQFVGQLNKPVKTATARLEPEGKRQRRDSMNEVSHSLFTQQDR